jgi:hypothetical protein
MTSSKRLNNHVTDILKDIHLLKLALCTFYETSTNEKEREEVFNDIERLDSIKIQLHNLYIVKTNINK